MKLLHRTQMQIKNSETVKKIPKSAAFYWQLYDEKDSYGEQI